MKFNLISSILLLFIGCEKVLDSPEEYYNYVLPFNEEGCSEIINSNTGEVSCAIINENDDCLVINDQCYYKDDINFLADFISLNNSLEGSEPLDIGFQEWTYGRLVFLNLEGKYLINLYKKSLLYLFTSYCEVFGLTTLEAMAQKTPVIVSNKSALPEINSNAAEYFDPDNIVEIKEKIKSIINDENNKRKLINNANDHYRKYNWEKNFSQTFSAIVKVNNA